MDGAHQLSSALKCLLLVLRDMAISPAFSLIVINHLCIFISVTKCTHISSTCGFLKLLVIALKEIWDCNHSFNKNICFINIKYILDCSVSMPFLQTQGIFFLFAKLQWNLSEDIFNNRLNICSSDNAKATILATALAKFVHDNDNGSSCQTRNCEIHPDLTNVKPWRKKKKHV